jgi:hypothetical protein
MAAGGLVEGMHLSLSAFLATAAGGLHRRMKLILPSLPCIAAGRSARERPGANGERIGHRR